MSHLGSQETYDFIADWIHPSFPYSKNDVWHRMGMIGVFGDYVLSSIQGDIAEIGVGESSIYLTKLAKKYNRNIYHCDIAPDKIINPSTVKGYLHEDGLYIDSNHGPVASVKEFQAIFYAGPSDQFFRDIDMTPLALSFIDGDHRYEQAAKDFDNLLQRTVDHGYILLHDTYPPSEEYLSEHRCGDVFRLRQEIESNPDLDSITLTRSTAMGVGLTIVRKKPKNRSRYNE